MVLSGEFPANAVHASASPSVVLAVGADDKFALPMTVALASALRHLDPTSHVTIYVLDGGIAPQNLARMRRCLHGLHPLAEINVIRVDDTRLDGFPTGWRLSKATYLRLLIPALIGPGWSACFIWIPTFSSRKTCPRCSAWNWGTVCVSPCGTPPSRKAHDCGGIFHAIPSATLTDISTQASCSSTWPRGDRKEYRRRRSTSSISIPTFACISINAP